MKQTSQVFKTWKISSLIPTFYILWMSITNMIAQNTNSIKAIARAKPDSIMLRWAPSDKETWKKANQYGYDLERITIVENNSPLKTPKKEKLNTILIKVLPLQDWESIASKNKYAAIAAQALYGSSFETEPKKNKQSTWQQLYQKDNEEDMRFSFALFAADMDLNTAKASGLSWTDKKVKKGAKYLYKIYLASPATTSSDSAFVFTGVDEYSPLPKPSEFRADFFDSTVVLTWNRKVQESVYMAYEIERADNAGQNFKLRSKEPFVPILKDNKNPFAFYSDTTPPNLELQYRIRGISAFGEKGPYSEIVKGMSKPSVQEAPQNLKYELLDKKKIKLSWSYDAQNLNKIQGFKVYRSSEHETGYKIISGAIFVPKTQKYFIDENPLSAGYYQIAAVDANGKEQSSFPVMVQFEDTEPPSTPKMFKGMIDKDGKVILSWTNNPESDLLGYYLYMSNSRKDEFSRITGTHVSSNTFTDKIDLKTLTDSIYYQVLALDKHYNESPKTLISIKRPDLIHPAPVAIISTEGTIQGIEIKWHNSGSKDAKQYLVSRGGDTYQSDALFAKIIHKGDSTTFLDTTAMVGKIYQYEIQTEDQSGLRSEKISSIKTQRKKVFSKVQIETFTGAWDEKKKNIRLSWKATGSPVKHWIIYRASQGERLAQYESATVESFIDSEVEKVKTYQYYLRPVFEDKTLGDMSEKLVVENIQD